ncbi:N/A [soil metagenome]
MSVEERHADFVDRARGEEYYEQFSHGNAVSKQARRFQIYALLVLTDLLAICAGFIAAGLLRDPSVFGANGAHLAALVGPLFLLVALNSSAYGYLSLLNWKRALGKALVAFAYAASAVLFVAFFARSSLEFSRIVYGTGSLLSVGLMIAGRFTFHRVIRRFSDGYLRSELIIIDHCEWITAPNARTIDAGVFGLRPNLRDPRMLDRLGQAVRDADYVLICCRVEDRKAWSLLLKGTDVQGHVLAPEFDDVGASTIGRYHGHCVLQVASGPLDIRSRLIKRAMDLAFTIPAIVLLAPVLILVAVAIRLESKGPVIFRQERMGRNNRLFSVFKFRSMRDSDSDPDGTLSAARDDARITRVGKWIRATSIDELPQLFNVLHGDMSLVGPRPHALGSLAGIERFWEVDQRYWHRHSLKPGITGLAQIRGLRGATLERDDLVKRLQADLEYLNEWTLWRDIGILAATVRVLIHPNAY